MVVVIEEERQEQVPARNTTTGEGDEAAETSSVMSGKDEGFETASEGGGDDDGEKPEEQEESSSGDGELTKQKSVAVAKDDSYQDALDDDQLYQKVLALANEAKAEGNALYKDGKYEDAILKYESALRIAPEIPKPELPLQVASDTSKPDSSVQVAPEIPKSESAPQVRSDKPKHDSPQSVAPEMTALVELRSICHSNCAMCFLKLGKYDDTVKECSKASELNPAYVKALHRRGEAFEKLERYEEAIKDMKRILELDPSDIQARRNIVRLEPLAHEKMEKMKEEMMGKLKDLGNNILGRFGMSVDNFKAVQDPNTGSYSISFQR